MEFNNTCSVYEKSNYDCLNILVLYATIAFLADYYRKYYEGINFDFDPYDEYDGVLCI